MELLEEIYKNASMGISSVTDLINDIKEKDNKIKNELEYILKEYQKFEKESEKLLKKKKEKPKETGVIAKTMVKMNIKKEVIADNSDAALADMLVQGITLGNLELEKKVKNSDCKEAIKLANEFIKFGEGEIDKLKKYL